MSRNTHITRITSFQILGDRFLWGCARETNRNPQTKQDFYLLIPCLVGGFFPVCARAWHTTLHFTCGTVTTAIYGCFPSRAHPYITNPSQLIILVPQPLLFSINLFLFMNEWFYLYIFTQLLIIEFLSLYFFLLYIFIYINLTKPETSTY